MFFSIEEKQELLAISGIGTTFISRLEEMGFGSVEILAISSVEDILNKGAKITESTCYKNSPQARKAAENAILWAKEKFYNQQ